MVCCWVILASVSLPKNCVVIVTRRITKRDENLLKFIIFNFLISMNTPNYLDVYDMVVGSTKCGITSTLPSYIT